MEIGSESLGVATSRLGPAPANAYSGLSAGPGRRIAQPVFMRVMAGFLRNGGRTWRRDITDGTPARTRRRLQPAAPTIAAAVGGI